MAATAVSLDASAQQKRSFWLKHLHQWHWVSAATCLIALVLFSITGFTLNHAGQIAAAPEVITKTATLPAPLLRVLQQQGADASDTKQPLPAEVSTWLLEQLGVRVQHGSSEWSPEDVYVSLPRPGGDAWLSIDFATGEVIHELTDRGWIAYFNDLHKGRNTGRAWSLFIDVFAFATLIFASTGLLLLKLHARRRPATWPAIGFGLVLPLLLALLFIH